VFLALPLVALILVGSFSDCKYHTEGCSWVGSRALVLLVVVVGLAAVAVVVVRLDASFAFEVE
jgi:hypothetical protein